MSDLDKISAFLATKKLQPSALFDEFPNINKNRLSITSASDTLFDLCRNFERHKSILSELVEYPVSKLADDLMVSSAASKMNISTLRAATESALLISHEIGAIESYPVMDSLKAIGLSKEALKRHLDFIDKSQFSAVSAAKSALGIVKTQGIDSFVNEMHTFNSDVLQSPWLALGDWRKPDDRSFKIFNDYKFRQELYLDKRFDAHFLGIPDTTFMQATAVSGLRKPELEYNRDLPDFLFNFKYPDEKEAHYRTNKAHSLLTNLERTMRQFIDHNMTKILGHNWQDEHLPQGMLEKWKEKKNRKEKKKGPSRPVLEYSDFTDYIEIITKKKNWDSVFMVLFETKEDVQESFRRLFPLRLDTMHSRYISKNDQMLLYSETMRLFAKINPEPVIQDQ